MLEQIKRILSIDWWLLSAAALLVAAGLVTMYAFSGENVLFERQLIWSGIALAAFFILAALDFHSLRKTGVVVALYGASVVLLVLVVLFGEVTQGAQSWFDLGAFSVQPVDLAKLALIVLLAKYFSRRHVEIAHVRHILISGFYALALFALVFLQPDFGSAIIIASIWLGMVLVSGISKKHLGAVACAGALIFAGLWFAPLHHLADTGEPLLKEYQKERVLTFLNPLTDLQGAGYNAYQSTIAVGSGQLTGKGVGFGTQSKLQFLPEYETDFVFAAFAEEWGFVGVLFIFGLFGVIIWRVLKAAFHGATNFEVLFGAGIAVLLTSQFVVHVGMNIGLLPVTGTVMPFMSYGGSHLVTEFIGLGILMGMRRYGRAVHREDANREFIGID